MHFFISDHWVLSVLVNTDMMEPFRDCWLSWFQSNPIPRLRLVNNNNTNRDRYLLPLHLTLINQLLFIIHADAFIPLTLILLKPTCAAFIFQIFLQFTWIERPPKTFCHMVGSACLVLFKIHREGDFTLQSWSNLNHYIHYRKGDIRETPTYLCDSRCCLQVDEEKWERYLYRHIRSVCSLMLLC